MLVLHRIQTVTAVVSVSLSLMIWWNSSSAAAKVISGVSKYSWLISDPDMAECYPITYYIQGIIVAICSFDATPFFPADLISKSWTAMDDIMLIYCKDSGITVSAKPSLVFSSSFFALSSNFSLILMSSSIYFHVWYIGCDLAIIIFSSIHPLTMLFSISFAGISSLFLNIFMNVFKCPLRATYGNLNIVRMF